MYDRDGITVDDRFARFGAKSYAINKITSLEVRSETRPGIPSKRKTYWVLAAAAALIAIAGGAYWLLVLAAILGVVGLRSKAIEPVTTYRLFLVTNAGENQALETTDGEQVNALRTSIEEAMARSG